VRLIRVDISNFRSLADVTIPLSPACRILVGINESGKSNILSALSLLDSETTSTDNDLRDFPPKEDPTQDGQVMFVFAFSKEERSTHYQLVSARALTKRVNRPVLTKGRRTLSLAKVCDETVEGLFIANLRTHAKTPSGWVLGKEYEIVTGWKRPKPDCPPTIKIVTEKGNVALKNLKLLWEEDCPENGREYLVDAVPEDVNDAVINACAQTITSSLPKCLYWRYTEASLLPGRIDLATFKATPNTCLPLKHMFALADVADIGRAISDAEKKTNGVRNLLIRVSERTTQHLRSVWKEYKGIRITLLQNGPNIEASIEDKYNIFDLARRSDGFKRFVTFLLSVSARSRTNDLTNTLYLHDEPDLGLHPSGARYLRDELIQISGTNYVVFSTHSPFMVDRDLIGRHLIVEKKHEVTTVEEVTESNIADEEVIYNALGTSIFDNLKPNNIVFEGWRDKRLFELALSNPPAAYRSLRDRFRSVGVCHARGARDIGRITPLLELGRRGWVVVSDSDKPAREQQKLYRGTGKWMRYDELLVGETVVTGEDFIRPESFKPHIERIASEHPGLDQLPAVELEDAGGKLAAVRKWLHAAKLPSDAISAITDDLKESLFQSVAVTDIEDKYYRLLSALAKKLPSL